MGEPVADLRKTLKRHAEFPTHPIQAAVCRSNAVGCRLIFRGHVGGKIINLVATNNSLRQTAHTHRASVHQAAKLVAALLRVAGVTAGLAESNGSLPPGL